MALIPWALDMIYRSYATHEIGNTPANQHIRGCVDSLTAHVLEDRMILEATREMEVNTH